ncbi:valine--tRNA ligase [Actinomycetaceae bacterium MB13-C1-2]|nr:valine--tRNA ligase [Actinomycetaceae bacterium MB13-C1-2]
MTSREPVIPTVLPSPSVPDRVSTDGLEAKWDQKWEESGIYRFDRGAERENIYSIDTPPPTVSGSLHVGHCFSYTHTDTVARYQRMTGKDVFYPMGWDDNGLPTERRVQNYYGVRCDPSLPYDADFKPPYEGGEGKSSKVSDQVSVSRQNFIELCMQLSQRDEAQFEDLWRYLGLSVDWSTTYQTIGNDARLVAQAGFLKNLERGEAYMAEAPGLWDVTFQTAVAQAEVEAREYPGNYYTLNFHSDGSDVAIETTRPELLGACVALIAHPEDERYQHLFGTTVITPGFGVAVPVLSHPMAEMDKGAGIAMCCTFGDQTDIQWWRELDLPLRTILDRDGRVTREVPEWITDPKGRELFEKILGKTTFSARKEIVEVLSATGECPGDPKPTQRMTSFYERGEKPLEIVTSRQWYIRNGGRAFTRTGSTVDLRDEMIERGVELNFHPDFMRVRYDNWVKGLNSDWLVSRQRFFGVPLPVWYQIDESGEVNYDAVLVPNFEQLPIDPSSDCPPGYSENQRDVAGGFHGEVDIMDTWATSSLTPQIPTGWLRDEELYSKLFPMDLRAQGQDILRTWLFSTVLRSNLEFDSLPWKNAAISGWILDSDHKKMSKSKGNVITPKAILDEYGSDAVRYWADSARLGADPAFDVGQIKIGRRLAIKLLNASKFALSMAGGQGDELRLDPSLVTVPVDASTLATLADVIERATLAFENYEHSTALEVTETFFWTFCDDYIELVKERAYNAEGAWSEEEAQSARSTLALAIDAMVRLLAPFLAFTAEEVWSWYREGSVHIAPWPTAEPYRRTSTASDPELLESTSAALIQLRRVKSEAKVSPRTPYLSVTVIADESVVGELSKVETDLKAAAKVTGEWILKIADVPEGEVVIDSFELGQAPPRK